MPWMDRYMKVKGKEKKFPHRSKRQKKWNATNIRNAIKMLREKIICD